MKTIKIIVLLCFISIGFSQNNNKHSIFVKAQFVPTVGVQLKLSENLSFRPSIMANISSNSSFIGNAAILWDINTTALLTHYLGCNFMYEAELDGAFIGLLAGVKTNINNKVGVFGEIGIDVGLFGDGIDSIGLISSGVGINYYLGK